MISEPKKCIFGQTSCVKNQDNKLVVFPTADSLGQKASFGNDGFLVSMGGENCWYLFSQPRKSGTNLLTCVVWTQK